jgi:hypothetical protein
MATVSVLFPCIAYTYYTNAVFNRTQRLQANKKYKESKNELDARTPSMKHSLEEKMAATTAKFLAEE